MAGRPAIAATLLVAWCLGLAAATTLVGCGDGVAPSPSVSAPAAAPAAPGAVWGRTTPAAAGFPAVVVLEPTAPAASAAPAPAASPVFLDQLGSAFYPPTLLARVGQTVEFSNSETVMHNVNVAADGGETVFNVASPPGFEPHRHVFTVPGVYRVTCDIHPNMSAFIVVTAAPWATVAAPDGRFRLGAVPPGRYLATVWSLDPGLRLEREIEVPARAGEVELDLVPAVSSPPPASPD